MTFNNLSKGTSDVIDNRLESFGFFPLRFILSLFLITGLALIGFALFVFNSNFLAIWGFILFIATYPLAMFQKRITINFTENTYREYYTFGGFKKMREWESFKGFTSITITPSTQTQSLSSRYGTSSIKVTNNEFHLNLKKDNYNKLNIAAGEYHSMLEKAIALALQHKVGIIDCRNKPIKRYTYDEVVENLKDQLF